MTIKDTSKNAFNFTLSENDKRGLEKYWNDLCANRAKSAELLSQKAPKQTFYTGPANAKWWTL